MKKYFIKFLPIVVAVFMTASCGKDYDNDDNPVINNNETELQATESADEDGYVTVPFSVRIGSGEGLSKMSCERFTDENGKQKVHRRFTDADLGKALIVTSSRCKQSALTLVKDGDGYKFSGSVRVYSTAVNDFKAGKVKLKGVMGDAMVKPQFSTVSLDDLMSRCAYEVCEEFMSEENATISLKDQNAYLEIILNPFLPTTTVTVNGVDYDLNSDKRLWIAVNNGTKITSDALSLSEKEALSGNIYRIVRGAVSVSDTKKVFFAQSNLQYNVTDGKFHFAKSVGSYVGNAEGNTTMNSGEIDLFGWGTWLSGNNPLLSGTTSSSYTWDDQKESAIGAEWETLTGDEWYYLLYERTCNARFYKGKANKVKGLLIFPDDFDYDAYPYKNNMKDVLNDPHAKFEDGAILLDPGMTGSVLDLGAVFLPAAGYRDGTHVYDAGAAGYYWSSTKGSNYVDDLVFADDGIGGYDQAYKGMSVRLVRTVK